MNVRSVLAVVSLCCLSLAGWEPVRVAEQALSPLLAPGAGWLRALLADDGRGAAEGGEPSPLAAQADAVWSAWEAELLRRPAPARAGVTPTLAPVLEAPAGRGELVIAVPERAVAAGSPVTWRGSLIGFVRPWRKDGERVDVDGRARVALLGHDLARPVAAQWLAGGGSVRVDFLLTSGEHGPLVQSSSRPVDPEPGALAWSRDTSALGDDLPPGLLLGRFAVPDDERPGGGLQPGSVRLLPLADVERLAHVVVESTAPGGAPCRRSDGHLMPALSKERLRVDRGLVDGVRRGDLVVQGAVLVGVVETAGPFASVLVTGLARGRLLVPDAQGRVVAVTPDAEGWPVDWRPEPGQDVFSGHRAHGGFHAGTLAGVRAGRLLLAPPPFDLAAPVVVLGP